MMTIVHPRPLRREDLPVFFRMAAAQLFETAPHIVFDEVQARRACEEKFTGRLPNVHCYVLDMGDGEIGGYMIAHRSGYWWARGANIWLEVLYLRPEYRTLQNAGWLLRVLDMLASDYPDVGEIFVGLSNGRRMGAVAKLFERCGYEPVGSYHRRIVRTWSASDGSHFQPAETAAGPCARTGSGADPGGRDARQPEEGAHGGEPDRGRRDERNVGYWRGR